MFPAGPRFEEFGCHDGDHLAGPGGNADAVAAEAGGTERVGRGIKVE